MKKQIKITALAAATVLGLSAAAYAAPAQLNVYGASAQGDFWVSEANPFLNSLGCKQADRTTAVGTGSASNGKITFASGSKVTYGYAKGYSCTDTAVPVDASTGFRDLEIRTGGIASLEGPLAVKLLAPLEDEADDGCAAGERKLLIGTTATDSLANLACYKVHVGTSDLKVENINQAANDENGIPFFMPNTSTYGSGLNADPALVVPFSFAVNTSVKARHCYTNTVANGGTRISGFYCTDDSHCGGGTKVCNATSETIDNLSRLQATLLFSGKVSNWQDLDKGFDSKNVVACIRVPGSGTHGAFEKTVMNAGDTGWGNAIYTDEDPAGIPAIDYVKSSDNMVDCVNGGTTNAGTAIGAVGYMDADKGLGSKTGLVKVNYQGAFPSRANIRKGVYDFYTVGQLYTNPTTVTGSTLSIYNKLKAFAQDPKNIPGTVVVSGTGTSASPYVFNATAGTKATWWAAYGEMKYVRLNDLKYPTKVTPQKYVNP